MSIILDVILLVVFVAFVYTAAKKGFMLSLLELVAVIVALALSYQFSPVVAQAAYDGFVEESLIETVETKIDETIDISTSATQIEIIFESIPDFITSVASSVGVDMEEIKTKISSEKLSSENLATELVEKVAQPIVIGALTVVCFLLLMFILLIVLKWLAKILAKMFKLPIIGKLNKALGGVLGACKGLIVVVLVCTILDVIFSGGENEIADAVNNSYIVDFLDNVNPFSLKF